MGGPNGVTGGASADATAPGGYRPVTAGVPAPDAGQVASWLTPTAMPYQPPPPQPVGNVPNFAPRQMNMAPQLQSLPYTGDVQQTPAPNQQQQAPTDYSAPSTIRQSIGNAMNSPSAPGVSRAPAAYRPPPSQAAAYYGSAPPPGAVAARIRSNPAQYGAGAGRQRLE